MSLALAQHLTVRVPATSANLGPGFDAFGLAVARYFIVATRAPAPDAPRILTNGEGADELAQDDSNLVWQSFVAFCDRTGTAIPDVRFEAVNAIPGERGLGSSSSAIVAGLALARAATAGQRDEPVSDVDLVRMATDIEGHPDNVAPAILGGLVVCARDDSGTLVIRRANPTPAQIPLVFVPVTRQSTHQARNHVPTWIAQDDVIDQAARAGIVVGAFTGAWPPMASLSSDRLHETPRGAVMPQARDLLANLRSAGLHSWLSGAGPTVMGITDRPDQTDSFTALAAQYGYEMSPHAVDLSGAIVCPESGCAYAAGGTCVQCPRKSV